MYIPENEDYTENDFTEEREDSFMAEKGTAILSETELEAQIKAKYPKVYKIDIDMEEIDEEFSFYFKKPSTMSFNRALKTYSKKALESMKALTLECIVDEQRIDFAAQIEEYPGLAMSAGSKLMAMLGVTDNITLKKL